MEKIKEYQGFQIYSIDEIDSTNTFLKQNYDKFNHRFVLVAEKQTAGRGRYDRKWVSTEDLCFSILFHKKYANEILAPLSIVFALKKYNIPLQIKWPNDIYYQEKKLSGILIENIYEDTFKASIVGIGMNILDHPEVNGIGIPINISKYEILASILDSYNQLLEQDIDTIIPLYKKHSNTIGKKVVYKNEIYEAIDIDEQGHLILKNDHVRMTICSNEVDLKTSIFN